MNWLLTLRPLPCKWYEKQKDTGGLWFESVLSVHVHLVLAVGLACAADHTLIQTFLFLLETVAAL